MQWGVAGSLEPKLRIHPAQCNKLAACKVVRNPCEVW
jgi:hypothetical protein